MSLAQHRIYKHTRQLKFHHVTELMLPESPTIYTHVPTYSSRTNRDYNNVFIARCIESQ